MGAYHSEITIFIFHFSSLKCFARDWRDGSAVKSVQSLVASTYTEWFITICHSRSQGPALLVSAGACTHVPIQTWWHIQTHKKVRSLKRQQQQNGNKYKVVFYKVLIFCVSIKTEVITDISSPVYCVFLGTFNNLNDSLALSNLKIECLGLFFVLFIPFSNWWAL